MKRGTAARKQGGVLRLLRGETLEAGRPAPRKRGPKTALRCPQDHGFPNTRDPFLNPIAFWGIAQSFSFVAPPQGNGIAERFIKTLKQQAVYGYVFRNAQEVHQAVEAFVHAYNHPWRIERLHFLTPAEARNLALQKEAA